MAQNQVSVEITLEEKAALTALTRLAKEINKTEGGFKSMGDRGDESLGIISSATKGVADGFGSLVKGVTVANLASEAIMGTANAIKGFVLESFNAAVEAEESNARLAQSLRSVGDFSEGAMEDFRAFATAMAEATIHGDDLIISQIAMAKSMGATNEQAKNMVRAATELSATFGGSLEERLSQLGKTLTGTGGKLDTLIPGFKALSEEQLKAGQAADFINGKFAGAAAAQLDTYAGKVGQMKKAWGEFQESVGGFFLASKLPENLESLGGWIGWVTKKMEESRIEAARQAPGFKATAASVEQLKEKYKELYDQEMEAKNIIADPSFMDKILARPVAAQDNLNRILKERAAIKAQIEKEEAEMVAAASASPANAATGGGVSEADAAMVASRKEAYAKMQMAKAEYDLWENEQRLLKTDIDATNFQTELETLMGMERAKIDAKYLAEEQKIAAMAESDTKRLLQEQTTSNKSLDIAKAESVSRKALIDKQVALETAKLNSINGLMQSGFGLAAQIAKDGSKEQFLIHKASAAAEIMIARGKAIAMIPAQTAHIPFPGNVPAAASLMANANIQAALGLATVAAAAIKGFEHGGIVGGSSMTGDLVHARLNSGEMVLNRQQQTSLFSMVNGGGGGGSSDIISEIRSLRDAIMNQPLKIVVDGREIASAVRREVQGGFRLV